MSRQLLVLRHAKSAWDTEAPTDFERPLSQRGKKDAIRMGKWLHQQGLVPDFVVSSPAKRAHKTVLKVCRELSIDKNQVHWDSRIYEAAIDHLLEVLADCPKTAQTVLLVGHNPGLEILVQYLCRSVPVPADGKLLPTATVAHLELPTGWEHLQEGVAALVSITRPSTLPKT